MNNNNFQRNIIFVTLILVVMVMLVIVCTRINPESAKEDAFENIEESDLDSDDILVGFSQLGSESVWRVANTKSIKTAFSEEKGFSLDFNNAKQMQENQIKAIRRFISEGVDYIAFAAVTEEGWDTVLQEARQANIPVILVDRKISTSDRSLYLAWIGSDAKAEGESAGLWLDEYLKEKGREKEEINIVVLMGNEGSSATKDRTQGFNAIAYAHRNWNILEEKNADFTTAKGKEVMEEFLDKYEDIDVVVSQNDDMTFGAIEAMKSKGVSYGVNGKVTVISFDAVHEALVKVQNGEINVDIECNPNEGEYLVDLIKKIENGDLIYKENVVEEMIFTQENVDEYIDNRSY